MNRIEASVRHSRLASPQARDQEACEAFFVEGFLLVYVCGAVGEGFYLKVGSRRVPRPALAIRLDSGIDRFLLIGRLGKNGPRSTSLVSVHDEAGRTLAGTRGTRKIPALRTHLLGLSQAGLKKVTQGFLRKLPELHTAIGGETLTGLGSLVALEAETWLTGMLGRVYFRVAFAGGFGSTRRHGYLRALDGPESYPLTLFLAGGFLYGVLPEPEQNPARFSGLWVLEGHGLGRWVIRLPSIFPLAAGAAEIEVEQETVLRFLEAEDDTVLSKAGLGVAGKAAELDAEGRVLGWAYDPERPFHPVPLDVYVDRQWMGRLMAVEPGSWVPRDAPVRHCGFRWKVPAEWLTGSEHELYFVDSRTDQVLDAMPFRLGSGKYDTKWSVEQCSLLVGRLRARGLLEKTPSFATHLDGVPLEGGRLEPAGLGAAGLPAWRFHQELPETVLDCAEHHVDVELRDAQGALVASHSAHFQARYRGHLSCEGARLSGWVLNDSAPQRPIRLEILANGAIVANTVADKPRREPSGQAGTGGFEVTLPKRLLGESLVSIALRVCGTQTPLPDFGLTLLSHDTRLRTLMRLAEKLNEDCRMDSAVSISGGLTAPPEAMEWLRTQVIAPLIENFRKHAALPSQVALQFNPAVHVRRGVPRERIVDIIVPVYGGRQETLDCLRSVMEANDSTPHELIVIDDATPDPALCESLQEWSRHYGFALLTHARNQGFVATANHGMSLHPQRDVVLLNADTRVPKNWLARLRNAAYRCGNIGSVTPMTNNGTICGFPRFNADNPAPTEEELTELDEAFARCNEGVSVDLPTAVGFCMYIKRDVLDEVGVFNESAFGHGYGEENDFCLRAARFGWRHVAACDVYVAHRGTVSFGAEKTKWLGANLKKLDRLYPDYGKTVQRFLLQDPLAFARNSVARDRLAKAAPRYLLFVVHSLGGGVKTHVDYMARRLTEKNCPVLDLTASADGHWVLRAHGALEELRYQGVADMERLLADLRELRVWHVHYHQTLGFPPDIWDLPSRLGVGYDFTAHDFLALCPRLNMIDETGAFCGESQFVDGACDRCVEINGFEGGLQGLGLDRLHEGQDCSIVKWRQFHQDKLAAARRVFVPSQDTARHYSAHFRLPNLTVRSHPEPEDPPVSSSPLPTGQTHRIAVIGAIGRHKGFEVLLKCARNALKDGLPLEFVLFGYSCDDQQLGQLANVVLAGAYQPESLPELVARSGCQVAAFFSVWPETYVYTLSEAWRCGLYPVAFDIGALGERIRDAEHGELIPLGSTAKTINRVLLEVATRIRAGHGTVYQPRPPSYASLLREYYGFS